MRHRILLLIVASACATFFVSAVRSAYAQDAAPATEQVAPLPIARITPGARVRFIDPWHDGATVEGRVTRRWADSVSIHPDGDPAPVDYRLAELHGVSVSDGRTVSGSSVGRGALYGAIGGAVAGGVLLSFMHHVESADKHSTGRGMEIGVAAAFGAVAGAVGGALHTPERWHDVVPQ